jgi:protein-tyrosine phosphatase/membrane-associated phospholipid phosphatase
MTGQAATGAAVIEPRPWRRALGWLAFLGPFFFLSYGFATWATAQRADVGAIVFGWEHRVPFVPWTIVPYWSIDVLYGISLFVCATRRELDTHARRLLTAQVIAVACFLAWPLRFTFDRPDTGGAFGWLFDLLGAFDKPFNQAPSLHIALLVILWALYGRHARDGLRWLVHGWFALIGVSVLTTWQHHFIDVPTGLLLGAFCLWLWPLDRRSPIALFEWTDDPQRRRLARRYGAGAAAAAVVALALGGAALWLLWPAVSLLLVAAIYAALGAEGFQKRDGRLSPGAMALLAPYVAGAWLNSRWWTRRRPAPDLIADGVWLGRTPSCADIYRFRFDAVIDMAAELPVPCAATDRLYAQFPALDLVVPDAATLADAAQAIERSSAPGRAVLVCCALGYSRSAAAVCAWLVASGRAADVDEAVGRIAQVRPEVVLSAAHRAGVAAGRAFGAAS